MRVLVDEEAQTWETSWDIVKRTFGYTNRESIGISCC